MTSGIFVTKKFAELEGKNTVSLKTGTWFGGSHLSLQKSLFMTYAFVNQLSYADTVRETSIDISEDRTHLLATSIETISDYKTIAENCAIKWCVMNLFPKLVV